MHQVYSFYPKNDENRTLCCITLIYPMNLGNDFVKNFEIVFQATDSEYVQPTFFLVFFLL
eukprot:UN18328